MPRHLNTFAAERDQWHTIADTYRRRGQSEAARLAEGFAREAAHRLAHHTPAALADRYRANRAARSH